MYVYLVIIMLKVCTWSLYWKLEWPNYLPQMYCVILGSLKWPNYLVCNSGKFEVPTIDVLCMFEVAYMYYNIFWGPSFVRHPPPPPRLTLALFYEGEPPYVLRPFRAIHMSVHNVTLSYSQGSVECSMLGYSSITQKPAVAC